MTIRNTKLFGIGIILSVFGLLAVSGIFYDYSLSTAGDETVVMNAVLRMINDNTLRPSYPTFYHLPLATYFYLPFFMAALLLLFVFRFHSMEALKSFVIMDSYKLLPLARFVTILFSLATVYLVYAVSEKLFKNRWISLLAAYFAASSLMFVYVSHFARVWISQIATIVFGLYILVLMFEKERLAAKDYICAALVISLSLGTHLIGSLVYVPFLVIHGLKNKSRGLVRTYVRNKFFWITNGVIAVCILVIFYLNPYGFTNYTSVIAPSLLSATPVAETIYGQEVLKKMELAQPFSEKITFYARTLVSYDPILTLVAFVSLTLLFFRRRDLFYILGSFVAVYYVLISFFGLTPRYISPVIPFLAIAAGYGVYEVMVRSSRIARTALVGIIIIATLTPSLALTRVFSRPSTRMLAVNWIYGNIPSGASLINTDTYLDISENKQTLEDAKTYTSFFTKKRAYLFSIDEKNYPIPNYYVYSSPNFQEIPDAVKRRRFNYLVVGWWNRDDLDKKLESVRPLLPDKIRLVKRFSGVLTPENGTVDLANDTSEPLGCVFSQSHAGPIVDIYKLD